MRLLPFTHFSWIPAELQDTLMKCQIRNSSMRYFAFLAVCVLFLSSAAAAEESLHYANVASSYKTLYDKLHGRANIEREVSVVVEHLDLKASDTFADIGGGTGAFTEVVRETAKPKSTMVVDPSAGMLEYANANYQQLKTVPMDALTFAKSSGAKAANKVLIRGTIHHIPEDQLKDTFLALLELLSHDNDSKLLIMTRPHSPSFPMFEEAKKVWMENAEPLEKYISAAENAGFHVEVPDALPLPVSMPLQLFFGLIRNRIWSTFSYFSDAELVAGIEEMKATYKGPRIEFNDDFNLLLLSLPLKRN